MTERATKGQERDQKYQRLWHQAARERDAALAEVEAAKDHALYLEQYVKRATDAEEALHRITELQPYEGPKAKAIAEVALADEREPS